MLKNTKFAPYISKQLNMKKFLSIILALFFFITLQAQNNFYSNINYENNNIEFDITDINTFEERMYFLYTLVNDSRFIVGQGEGNGIFVISLNDSFNNNNLHNIFENFRKETATSFEKMGKDIIGEKFYEWKSQLPDEYINNLMMDIYIKSRQNNRCNLAEPFCTDVGLYQFPAGVNAGSGEVGPNYNCLSTTPNPAWYYMRIATPGNINIYMYSTPSEDIDFCCWGPFDDPVEPCPSGLTSNKVVSCSYSANPTETCIIPSSAQTGEYYILIITNFSNHPCDITFSKTSGTGTTDCSILPPLISSNEPCVGGTLNLRAEDIEGATYSWTGPGGWTSNQRSPQRSNVTMSMAGTYTCHIQIGSQQSEPVSIEVTVHPMPQASFTNTTVCQETPTQFTCTSTTSPSGYENSITSRQWNFGDGSTGSGASVSHTYAQGGTYTVTLNVLTGGECVDSETKQVTVYSNPNANAGPDQTIGYGGVATLSGSGGNGTFTYRWEPADKVVNPNAQTTQTRALTQSTTFTLTVSGSSDCTDDDRVTINVDGTAMTASVNADDTELCQGESTTLHATASGGTSNYTYTWNPTTGLSNPSIPNPVASPNVTTEYTCTIHDGQTQQTPSITIVVHPQYNDIQDFDEVCQYSGNGYYTSNGFNISTQEAGTFTQTITKQTSFGCDSIVTMNLTVHPAHETTLEASICDGGSYPFFGENLTEEGIYKDTLLSVNGCDSIIILNLSITDQYTNSVFVSTCNEPYTWDWGALGDTVINNSGEYVHTFESLAGCDSVVTLYFERYPNYIGENQIHDYQTHCDVLTWEGEVFYESGDYTKTLRTVNGCDSIVTLHLTINESTESYVVETSCGSFTMLGHSYTNPAHYVDTIHTLNEYGCLEVVNLDLWLHSVPQIDPITGITPPLFFTGTGFDLYEYSIRNASGGGIEQGFPENYEWDLVTSESSENWTLIPSENSAIVSLTRPGYAYLYCYVTTECGTDTLWTPLYTMGYEPIGIDEHNAGSLFHIYPNPTNGNVYISYSGLTTNTPVTISVYNSNGLLVKKFDTRFTPSISAVSFSMNEVNNGLYIIKVTGKEFNIYKKLILNK